MQRCGKIIAEEQGGLSARTQARGLSARTQGTHTSDTLCAMSDIDSQSGGSADSAENVDGIDDNEWDWGADEQQASTRCAAKPCQYSPPWALNTVACPVARMRVAFL